MPDEINGGVPALSTSGGGAPSNTGDMTSGAMMQESAAPATGATPSESSAQDNSTTGEQRQEANGQAAPASPAVDWNDAQNPYRYAAEQLHGQLQQYQQQENQRRLAWEKQTLLQRGVAPEHAEAAILLRQQQQQMAQQQEEINRRARPLVADKLVAQIKQNYGVDIKPEELLTTNSGVDIMDVQSMLARADAIVGERRRGAFDKRVASGVDATPRSESSVVNFDPSSLKGKSPSDILAMGLRRMNNEE